MAVETGGSAPSSIPERGYLSDDGSRSTTMDLQRIELASVDLAPHAPRQQWRGPRAPMDGPTWALDGLAGGLIFFFSFYNFINSDGHLDRLSKLTIYHDLKSERDRKTTSESQICPPL